MLTARCPLHRCRFVVPDAPERRSVRFAGSPTGGPEREHNSAQASHGKGDGEYEHRRHDHPSLPRVSETFSIPIVTR